MTRTPHLFTLALLATLFVGLATLGTPNLFAEEDTSLEPAFEVSMDLKAASGSLTKSNRHRLVVSQDAPSGAQAPKLLKGSAPFYPERARKARIQGSTTVGGVIDRQGVVRNIVTVDSPQKSSTGLLDEAAMGALSRWRFEPGTLDGEPVAVAVELEVHFRLVSGGRQIR